MREHALIFDRSDAHPWTYSTDMLGVVPDDLHFTVDIKDSKMMQDNTHLTAHGYVKELKTTDDFSNLFNIGSVEIKEDKKGAIKIEKDQYFDKKKKYVNNWNMAKLEAFDEPEEMSRMRLGDKFTDVLSSELAKIDDNHQAKHTQEAVKEEQQVREALEREGNDKLGKD